MSGETLPRGRSSPTFSTNLLSRSKQPRCSAPAPGRCWCGPALRRASCLVSFRRVSNRGAMASVCRSWSAGRILMRRSARRWLNVKRRSRSSRPGLLTSPTTRRCRASCCCLMSGRSVRSLWNCIRFYSADGYRLRISTFTRERCWRRAAIAWSTSSARSGSASRKKCAASFDGWAMRVRCCSRRRQSRKLSQRRLRISSNSRCAAGKARRAPRRFFTTMSAVS